MARRLPRWVTSDRLTALALAAMAMTGLAYAVAPGRPWALTLAIAGLAVNWFGDSLDGTLARVRGQQRPRYGFYVDHVLDCFGVLFVVAGLAAGGYMTPVVAMALLIAYFMLSIEIYLATYCLAVFRLSFWGVGPTELRLLLAVGTAALVTNPQVRLLGIEYPLFDVGGAIATLGIVITLIISVVRNTRLLYEAEPLR
jgi:archaetidylinositol phosphate synthase